MSDAQPITYQWNGEAMEPLNSGQAKRCDAIYVVGETYTLAPYKGRSGRSHNHYFACINEAWETLPDMAALHFPSSEHLRKHALVRKGYADKTTVACESPKEARKFVSEMKRKDLFALVELEGNLVVVWSAHSQSKAEMGNAVFQQSKSDVLDWIAETFGYAPQDLGKAA